MAKSTPGKLKGLDVDAVIGQLSAGRFLRQIATDHNVTKRAVYEKVKDHPGYAEALQSQAEALVEIATTQVMECDAENVNIARARVDAAHKWAAARDPARWAPRQAQVVINNNTLSLDSGSVESISDLLKTVASEQHAALLPDQVTQNGTDTDT